MIYFSSPYSHTDKSIEDARYDKVCEATAYMTKKTQQIIYSPIAHWHPIARKYALPTDAKFWEFHNRAVIALSTRLWVLCIPGWQESKGVTWELELAGVLGQPISYVTEHREGEFIVNAQAPVR